MFFHITVFNRRVQEYVDLYCSKGYYIFYEVVQYFK